MILIFGGTTEGRIAVSVCEESGKPFYYSTKGEQQKIDLVHGSRICGGMDREQMIAFCNEKSIHLIIDVAHPFAEVLHQNILNTSLALNIPVLRLERNYADHDDSVLWFDTYTDAVKYLEKAKIENLLALTGVNTIAKLKDYWLHHDCTFRILDRDESRAIVEKEGFPIHKVLYYQQGADEVKLFDTLKPQAIITKESGESGGFLEKIEAAKALNIPFLVVKRPKLSDTFISVYGEHGLRKQIETLYPDFFPLKTGYTTGTSATAATKAALTTLLTGEQVTEVIVSLPDNERVKIPIHSTIVGDEEVTCSVIKDAGDDPDVTHGHEICSTVRLSALHKGVKFLQGVGVGRVTLPGLDSTIGEPSINKTPRMMMKREIFKVMRHRQDQLPNQDLKAGVDVTISVPDGEELALKTFNPKLGIIGGISIIGTSGVVKPFSSDAFIASIQREIQVAIALKCTHIVINSGAKSEKYVKQRYPNLLDQSFIHYGNFIGETIATASKLGMQKVSMGIMIGKAVKLAEGSLDTHSKKVVMNKYFLQSLAQVSNCSDTTIEEIGNITMARQLWEIVPKEGNTFFQEIINRCYYICKPLLPDGELEVLLITEAGDIL